MSLLRSAPASTVETVTSQAPEPDADRPAAQPLPRRASRPSRLGSLVSPLSPAPIYLGITLTIAGFGVLIYTWSRVAGTAIVALQLPFIVSGGFGGLGLIVVGLLAINVGAKRRDAWLRDRRLEELAAMLDAAGVARADDEPAPRIPDEPSD